VWLIPYFTTFYLEVKQHLLLYAGKSATHFSRCHFYCCCCCCGGGGGRFFLQIVVSFVQLALLGAALGLGFGLVTSFWLANIWNDPGLEIILTLGAAYACYFVSEELAGASGLLAVVVMGFSMSLLGRV